MKKKECAAKRRKRNRAKTAKISPKRKPGRQSLYPGDAVEAVFFLASKGFKIKQIAEALRTSTRSAYRWSIEKPYFKAALEDGRAELKEMIEQRESQLPEPSAGRPSEYKPIYGEITRRIHTEMAYQEGILGNSFFAAIFNVSLSTISAWKEEHPEFADAFIWGENWIE